jgi:hypothetical protein
MKLSMETMMKNIYFLFLLFQHYAHGSTQIDLNDKKVIQVFHNSISDEIWYYGLHHSVIADDKGIEDWITLCERYYPQYGLALENSHFPCSYKFCPSCGNRYEFFRKEFEEGVVKIEKIMKNLRKLHDERRSNNSNLPPDQRLTLQQVTKLVQEEYYTEYSGKLCPENHTLLQLPDRGSPSYTCVDNEKSKKCPVGYNFFALSDRSSIVTEKLNIINDQYKKVQDTKLTIVNDLYKTGIGCVKLKKLDKPWYKSTNVGIYFQCHAGGCPDWKRTIESEFQDIYPLKLRNELTHNNILLNLGNDIQLLDSKYFANEVKLGICYVKKEINQSCETIDEYIEKMEQNKIIKENEQMIETANKKKLKDEAEQLKIANEKEAKFFEINQKLDLFLSEIEESIARFKSDNCSIQTGVSMKKNKIVEFNNIYDQCEDNTHICSVIESQNDSIRSKIVKVYE